MKEVDAPAIHKRIRRLDHDRREPSPRMAAAIAEQQQFRNDDLNEMSFRNGGSAMAFGLQPTHKYLMCEDGKRRWHRREGGRWVLEM